MTKRKNRYFILLIINIFILLSFNAGLSVSAGQSVYLGGMPAGFSLLSQGAYVVGVSDIVTTEGVFSPSKMADIRVGDILVSVNGKTVADAISVAEALAEYKSDPVEIILRRGNTLITKYVTPRKDFDGSYKLGVFLRDNISGIGTITYFTEDGEFASLGHPISDDDGKMLEISGGTAYLCSVIGLVKGERGKAGELKGVFVEDTVIGEITANTYAGIFGKTIETYDYRIFDKLETGTGSIGKAQIYTCTDGVKPEKYDINIVKVDRNNPDNKNYVIKISDEWLLKKTNGILQGMSGSPIIQNGKIVGAITHVFINDPTRGFGISIEKMLNN